MVSCAYTYYVKVTLATGFSLMDGEVDILIPGIDPGTDYSIIREY